MKQNPDYPQKKYNAIFKHIHQNIRAYLRSKKICVDQWLGKCYCILGRILAKSSVYEQVWFVTDTVLKFVGYCNTRNSFYSHLMETVFPA